MGRRIYLQRCLAAQFSAARFHCPNCGSKRRHSVVDRKYFITQLRRCVECSMMFRTPTDDPEANAKFYESEYTQGFTTDLPSGDELEKLKQSNFAGTEKDYSYFIGILNQLGLASGSKIFDYGCSWGYGSYQLTKAGFDVTAFEIAATRRKYAEQKLGVRMVEDMDSAADNFAGQFDCFFSSHVIEHVPSPRHAFAYAMRLLRKDGLFVSFTPNGCKGFRLAHPKNWHMLWGEVHPNMIDDIFLNKSFSHSPRCAGSSPVDNASLAADNSDLARLNALDAFELFFAARRTGDRW